MQKSIKNFSVLFLVLKLFVLNGCAGDQGQEEDGYDQQGQEEYDQEAGQGESENYGDEEGAEGTEGDNYGNEAGNEQGNLDMENTSNYSSNGQGQGQGQGQGNNFSNNVNANTYQQGAENGEELNNTTADEYSVAAGSDQPAVDQQVTQEAGQQQPLGQATYVPGEVPAGWAKVANGYIPLSSLSEEPIGYLEAPATWQ